MTPRAPRSTLFPYTTLFRSAVEQNLAGIRPGHRMHGIELHAEAAGQQAANCIEIEQGFQDRKSTRLNSSHVEISYAVFCSKKKTGRRDRAGRRPAQHPLPRR